MLKINVHVEWMPALNIFWIGFYVVALGFGVERFFFTRLFLVCEHTMMVDTCAVKLLLTPRQ